VVADLRDRTLDRGSVTAEFVLLLPLIVVFIGLLGSVTLGQFQELQALQAGQQVARAMQLGLNPAEANRLAASLGITYLQHDPAESGMASNIRCIYATPIRRGPLGLAFPEQRVCYLAVGQ